LPERRAARLHSPWATPGSRRQLARPPDHPGRVGSGGDHRAPGPIACVARYGHANRGLRLSDVDPSRRAQDVHALGRARAADLRRSSEQARHGEHRRARGLRSPCVTGDGRALVGAGASVWRLAGAKPADLPGHIDDGGRYRGAHARLRCPSSTRRPRGARRRSGSLMQ
jgi:hypothetical protein